MLYIYNICQIICQALGTKMNQTGKVSVFKVYTVGEWETINK